MLRTGLMLLVAAVVLAGAAAGQDIKKKIEIPKVAPVIAPKAATGQDTKKKIEIPKVAPVIGPKKGESKTFDLFDGKTLSGWEGYEKYWSVQDGVIVGKNTKPIPQSTYLVTKEKFSDFRLIGDVKLAESEMHSGIAFWGKVNPNVVKDPEKEETKYTYQGHLFMFPKGWGMFDLFRRGGLGKYGVDNRPGIEAGKGRDHEWNHIEILAQGNRVRGAANGKPIVDWREPSPEMIEEGPIGLQLHQNKVPQQVEFKNLKIETFPREDRLITVK